jgi:hypothetical protein
MSKPARGILPVAFPEDAQQQAHIQRMRELLALLRPRSNVRVCKTSGGVVFRGAQRDIARLSLLDLPKPYRIGWNRRAT